MKIKWKENLYAVLLGFALFVMVLVLLVVVQDLSSSKFIYVDF